MKVLLILGDNIFISDIINSSKVRNFTFGAEIFTIPVKDPERYGVVKLSDGIPIDIVEKPSKFVSDNAVTGLYFYDSSASKICKRLKPSQRNELEITDLNKEYLNQSALSVTTLGDSDIWLDAGTFDSLLDAGSCISALQKRLGRLVGSPELTSYSQGFLGKEELLNIISNSPKNSYYKSLISNIS